MNYKLENGVNIILLPNHEYNKMFTAVMINAGALDNTFYLNGNKVVLPSGIAHFLEHKIFEMENNDATLEFSKLGANVNAFTSYDVTSYYFTTTKKKEESLSLLLNMVFNANYKEKSVNSEKNIILQELDMYKDMPDMVLEHRILKNLYKNHPIKEDLGGTSKSVSETKKSDLDAFFKAFYQCNFVSIAVVGNFDVLKIKKIINEFNFPISKNKIEKIEKYELTSPIKKTELKLNVELSKIGYGLRFKNIDDIYLKNKVSISIQLLINIYLGESSKLFHKLMKDSIVNDSFYYEVSSARDTNIILFTTDTENVKKSRSILKKAIKDLKDYNIGEKEFERIKKMMYGKYYLSLNSLENIGFINLRNSFYDLTSNDILEIFKSIKLEDVIDVKSYIDFDSLTEVVILPN